MADMSLEDVIKERKISLKVNSGNFRGTNRRITSTGNRAVASRPLMVVTGLGKVKLDARFRLQPKANTSDNRSVQTKPSYRDARYKLNEIARKTDARIKIEAKKRTKIERLTMGNQKINISSIKNPHMSRMIGNRASSSGLIVRTADGGLVTKKNVVTQTKSMNIIRTSKGLLKTINATEVPHRSVGLSSRTALPNSVSRTFGNSVEKWTQPSSIGINRGVFVTSNSPDIYKRQTVTYDNDFDSQLVNSIKRRSSSDDDDDDLHLTTSIKKRLNSHENYSQVLSPDVDFVDNSSYSVYNSGSSISSPSSSEISRPVKRSNSDLNIVSSHFPVHRFSEPEDDDPTVFSPLQGYKVSITNLDQFVSEEDIVELFGEIGPLKRASLTRPGMAEVVYSQRADAIQAVKEYDNRELDGRPMQCHLVNPERVEYVPETIILQSGRSLGLPRESSSLPVERQLKSHSSGGSTSSKGLENFDVTVIHRALFKTAVPGPVRPVKFTVKV